MTQTLAKMLGEYFAPPAPKRRDPHRKARELAKQWAAEWGVEIEPIKRRHGGGFDVWPPKGWAHPDPLEGDHYCNDWEEVYEAVCQYRPHI